MNHNDLYKMITDTLKDLRNGKIKHNAAQTTFNGVGKAISLTNTQMKAIAMGFPSDITMLGIKQIDSTKPQQKKVTAKATKKQLAASKQSREG